MNITAKSRYALKFMLDLALRAHEDKQNRQKIADRNHIPLEFMDQIMARLRKSGLIISLRGRNGGIKLARSTDEITLWDIFSSVEDHLEPVKCLTDHHFCAIKEECNSVDVWSDVYELFQMELSKKSLSEILQKQAAKRNVFERPIPSMPSMDVNLKTAQLVPENRD